MYVVARFLERLWRDGRPFKKTDLQMAVRLNYSNFKRYLDWLEKKGLVAISAHEDGHERITLTRSGREAYHTVITWIRDMVGEDIR